MRPFGSVRRGLSFAAVLFLALAAWADEPVAYLGPHPPHPAAGGRFCEVEGEHVHEYVPVDPSLWVKTRGVWVYLGDPTAAGYDGPTWLWPGPHPLPVSLGLAGAVCPLTGMHRHAWGPEAPAVVVRPAFGAPAGVVPFFLDRPPPRRRPPPPHHFDTTPPTRTPEPPPPAPPASGSFPSGSRRSQRHR